MTFLNTDYIEICNKKQFQKLSSLYNEFCVFVYSNQVPWSRKILTDNSISTLLIKKYTKMLVIDLSKYPELIELLDINIYPMFLIYRNQILINQISPLFENITNILNSIL